ncbi:replication initiator protein A [Streptobacillus moniliformis]|uniref:Replication initiator A domain protein n=1 Tax=Streptobacillus moniliformis (strain ATCC 14647 / DSM 12112 / NCTC 10651 / 9901) TaxID=519441 RepID=D1AYJ7_STRM9|nr:replication initiator protein A [Streptobacillus moniliformis]ACZ01373.1 replication initiator A domain protein [Streptobacillus moniliformis DSM 12112]AVL43613.1 replication initiator RepA [Streptobacillus moniliformis]SQA13467.1 Replication initiator protein A (RepA) N-terminus [Streptobacillus moniliformis]SQA14554.1 Replication initiator protein A (RepA) N-terminus [Streptobacillus moniliformis]SQA14559.1 Replication initiator protein A (RepA) N-terminus [Streptobacillus moniliformis]
MSLKFKISDISYQSFLVIPKDLIYDKQFKELSLEAKLMYGMLLDRLQISLKNNWIDKSGNIYLIYSINEIMCLFHIGKNSAIKILKELEYYQLLEKERRGLGKPNLLYLKKIDFSK